MSVGPNMFNGSSFNALSHWHHVYGSQIYRLMVVAIIAMHTANMHNILIESLLSDVEIYLNGSEL